MKKTNNLRLELKDDVIDWLKNYCKNCKIHVLYPEEATQNDVSDSFGNLKIIIFNENWKNQKETPFMLAHEIGHIVNGDTYCFHNFSNGVSREECKANRFAIKLLVTYCRENDIFFESKYSFAEAFGIPSKCFYILEEACC